MNSKRARTLAMILAAASLAGAAPVASPDQPVRNPEGSPSPAIWAVEYGVREVGEAAAFYERALGFRTERRHPDGSLTLLNGGARLSLRQVSGRAAGTVAGRTYLNFTVGSLEHARRMIRDAGGSLRAGEPEESAVGPYLEGYDPSGNPFHLIDHPWDDEEKRPESPAALFNIGLSVADMRVEERFFTDLGFQVSTRDYLPETLVFERAGIGYFVMHVGDPGEPGAGLGAILLAAGGASLPVVSPSGIAVRPASGR